MNAALNSILARLETIGLTELNERASMLTRVDRKYALEHDRASAILSHLPEATRVLQVGASPRGTPPPTTTRRTWTPTC